MLDVSNLPMLFRALFFVLQTIFQGKHHNVCFISFVQRIIFPDFLLVAKRFLTCDKLANARTKTTIKIRAPQRKMTIISIHVSLITNSKYYQFWLKHSDIGANVWSPLTLTLTR